MQYLVNIKNIYVAKFIYKIYLTYKYIISLYISLYTPIY